MRCGPMFVACLVALAEPALAHETGDRAMGVVESVAPDRLVLKASDGHALAFTVTPETRFTRGDKQVKLEDVRAGERAVVQAKRAGDEMQAVRVKLGAVTRRR